MRHYAKAALFGAVALTLAAGAAIAGAPATPAPNVIDLSPLWSQVSQLIMVGLLGFATWAIGTIVTKVKAKFGIDVEKGLQDKVLAFAELGAGMVLARIENMAHFEIKVGNPLIASGANWVIQQVEPELRKLGVTKEREKEWVQALLAGMLGKMTKNEPDNSKGNPASIGAPAPAPGF